LNERKKGVSDIIHEKTTESDERERDRKRERESRGGR
jgi:hypothetical protein